MPTYFDGERQNEQSHQTPAEAEYSADKPRDYEMLQIRRRHWEKRNEPDVQQLIYRRMYCGSRTVPKGMYLGSRAECHHRGTRIGSLAYKASLARVDEEEDNDVPFGDDEVL
jgi:hypothetical protein